MRAWARLLTSVIRKDLLLEARAKRGLFLSAVFSMLVTVAFAFGFHRTVGTPRAVGRSALWVSFLFGGVVLVTQTASVEGRDAALEGLLLAPGDRTAVFLGKTVANAVFLLGMEIATIGFVTVFLGSIVVPAHLPRFFAALALAAVGYAAAGTLLSLLTVRSALPAVTLPLVLVPVVIPVLVAGLSLTRATTGAVPVRAWMTVLAAYDGILLFAGIALFEPLVET
ncbi:MAG: heme exporter protein CcmB [Halodesulfurarchaeum sp.]